MIGWVEGEDVRGTAVGLARLSYVTYRVKNKLVYGFVFSDFTCVQWPIKQDIIKSAYLKYFLYCKWRYYFYNYYYSINISRSTVTLRRQVFEYTLESIININKKISFYVGSIWILLYVNNLFTLLQFLVLFHLSVLEWVIEGWYGTIYTFYHKFPL